MALLKRPAHTKGFRQTWKNAGPVASSYRPQQVGKPAPCAAHCPCGTDMRGALSVIAQRDKLALSDEQAFEQAWRMIVATNPFPAVLGRICPHPCEQGCNRQEKDAAVSIAAVERFLGDWGIASGRPLPQPIHEQPPTHSVAVVGAGPAGLSCAYQLARRGHAVSVFESAPRPGGMLRYGVPAHRLSRGVLDAEIARLLELPIALHCGATVGRDPGIDELRKSFDAVFVAIGAHLGRPLAVPGADADVLSGVEFLRRASADTSLGIGPRVVVIGDGQTAIDVARVANRIGIASGTENLRVTLVRARSEEDEDLQELACEGITVEHEAAAVAITRSDDGTITAVSVQRARLGPPDCTGQRLPIPINGGPLRSIPTNTVIAAVSQCADWRSLGLFHDPPALEVDSWGRTRVTGVWSGGDSIVPGIAVQSVSQGLRAALSIDAALTGGALPTPDSRQPVSTGRVKLTLYEPRARSSIHRLTPEESLHNHSAEIEQGITLQQAVYEAQRCLSCGACLGCERCWIYCTPGCFSRVRQPRHGEPYFVLSLAACDGCRKCADECPSGFIEML
jgi:NADPH-dependent glutamate synthase beta subunit-like oxidoreductase